MQCIRDGSQPSHMQERHMCRVLKDIGQMFFFDLDLLPKLTYVRARAGVMYRGMAISTIQFWPSPSKQFVLVYICKSSPPANLQAYQRMLQRFPEQFGAHCKFIHSFSYVYWTLTFDSALREPHCKVPDLALLHGRIPHVRPLRYKDYWVFVGVLRSWICFSFMFDSNVGFDCPLKVSSLRALRHLLWVQFEAFYVEWHLLCRCIQLEGISASFAGFNDTFVSMAYSGTIPHLWIHAGQSMRLCLAPSSSEE